MAITLNRYSKYEELYAMYKLNQMLIEETIREARMNNNNVDTLKANKRLQELNKNKEIILNTFEYEFENEKKSV